MKSRYLYTVLIFIVFIIEGTIFQIFITNEAEVSLNWVPRLSFLLILLLGFFQGRVRALFMAIFIGLLFDVIFSPALGIYSFGMGFIAYSLAFSYPFVRNHLVVLLLLIMSGFSILEYYVFGMMSLLGLTTMTHEVFFHHHFLPSFILNFIVILVLIYPLRLWLLSVEKRLQELD